MKINRGKSEVIETLDDNLRLAQSSPTFPKLWVKNFFRWVANFFLKPKIVGSTFFKNPKILPCYDVYIQIWWMLFEKLLPETVKL